MVRHEAIGVHGATMQWRKPPKLEQVVPVVGVSRKADGSIVTPLDYMQGNVRQYQSGAPGHFRSTDRSRSALTEKRGPSLFFGA
jgi:hypothetical protein